MKNKHIHFDENIVKVRKYRKRKKNGLLTSKFTWSKRSSTVWIMKQDNRKLGTIVAVS